MIPKANGKLRRWGSRPPGTGSCKPPQAGARADLRGGLRAVLATASARGAGPRTPSPRSTSSPPSAYEWVLEGGHQGLLRRDRPLGPDGPGARRIGDKRVLALVKAFLKPASSPRTASRGTRRPARPKAASSRRCWPTSRSRSSTSTSSRPGRANGRLARARSSAGARD